MRLGNFVVMFKPGVVTGIHSEREVLLADICQRMGGFECKVFDPYMFYSAMADDGLLVRVEHRNEFGYASASFFYPDRESESKTRKMIINRLLSEIKGSGRAFSGGCAVVCDKSGNYRLITSSRSHDRKSGGSKIIDLSRRLAGEGDVSAGAQKADT
ncbi:MAG: hypothetical protein K6T65_05380 [Peptococcaceae bacterium]|nr:hypothetical protein [Peptococcaceae bacterium]